MLSQYLLIHSEGIKATIKEISGKTPKQLFYDPSLAHKGGSGDKTDWLFKFIFLGIICLNTVVYVKLNFMFLGIILLCM